MGKKLTMLFLVVMICLSLNSNAWSQYCVSDYGLGCGDTDSWSTTEAGATSVIKEWACQPGFDYSGPEYTYEFMPDCTGTATVTLKKKTMITGTYLDLMIGDGSKLCSGGNCIASGLMLGDTATVNFQVESGKKYWIVVDGWNGAKGYYDLSIQCNCTSEAGACHDSIDNDKDGKVDCVDPDCLQDPWCSTKPCVSNDNISADATVNADTTKGSQNVPQWSCWPNGDYTAPEYVFTYTALCDGKVSFSLKKDASVEGFLDLFIADGDKTCQKDNCLYYQLMSGDIAEIKDISITKGKKFFVIVDGYNGTKGKFTLTSSTTCNSEVGLCADQVDNDKDGKVDCDDSDCAQDSACKKPCNPSASLACDASANGDTEGAGATNNVKSWSCVWGDYSAPEYTYNFSPSCDGQAIITLKKVSLSTGNFLDLFIGDGDKPCGWDNCLAYDWMSQDIAEVAIDVAKGKKYLITVDGYSGAKGKYTISTKCICANEKGQCADKKDNDGDGKTDCQDSDCASDPICQEQGNCNDKVDNDLDGQTDCFDIDCKGDPACPKSETGLCGDKFDNDFDELIDCIDPDCGDDPLCNKPCVPAKSINCTATDSASTLDPSATNNVYSWSCISLGQAYWGPEYTYTFIPNCTGKATVSLKKGTLQTGSFLDLVIGDGSVACGKQNCIASALMNLNGSAEVTFDVVKDKKYLVIVDGYQGAAGSFTISTKCDCGLSEKGLCNDQIDNDNDTLVDCKDPDCKGDPACPSTEKGLCADLIDNDGDGLMDCNDEDCKDDPLCKEKPCISAKGIGCNATDSADTTGQGATSNVNSWSCESGDYTAPEFTYTFTASCTGKAQITVVKGAEVEGFLDLFIGDGAKPCGKNNCIASDWMVGDKAEVLIDVKKDSKYSVTIDGYEGAKGQFTLSIKCDCGDSEKGFCADKIDNDNDGLVDCLDPDCKDDPLCKVVNEKGLCADKIDNDNDGFIDCLDSDCKDDPNCCKDDCIKDSRTCASDTTFQICGNFDGDPCLEWGPPTACPVGLVCINGQCQCKPNCAGKECGDDGCGGSCGKCPAGKVCGPNGKCIIDKCGGITFEGCCDGEILKWCEDFHIQTLDCNQNPKCGWNVDAKFYDCGTDGKADPTGINPQKCPCTPQCEGKECGDDGCGGTCGQCPPDKPKCQNGKCVTVCTPNCVGKECGDDGCGGSCGQCPEGKQCNALGICQSLCSPNCQNKECGDDGCGGICGKCPEGKQCVDGKCKCIPQCFGKECGDDGCGGSCGTCPIGKTCVGGKCVCQPNCEGKQCGPDGCGGTCGECKQGEVCQAGICKMSECGAITYEGCCEGEILKWCENNKLKVLDCTNSPKCGWNDAGFYDCGTDGKPDPSGEFPMKCECIPSCLGKECGDDGCGGSCGQCTGGKSCVNGKCQSCIPKCDGKECGDDGCGGLCGTCPADKPNCNDGKCEKVCKPNCSGKSCGDDGCGGSCGQCRSDAICDPDTWTCVDKCKYNCKGKECGPDGCGGTCGLCKDGFTCVDGKCQCVPQCQGKECGPDGCGGQCGTCPPGVECTSDGRCHSCTPNCTNKECGDDGCGGSCGSCQPPKICNPSTFKCESCVADCTNKECGDDGCGGSCGTCGDGKVCVDGVCVEGSVVVEGGDALVLDVKLDAKVDGGTGKGKSSGGCMSSTPVNGYFLVLLILMIFGLVVLRRRSRNA